MFRDYIKLAKEAQDLEFPAMQVLKEKLEALNEYYEDSYRELGEEMTEKLMNTLTSEFW